MSSQTRSGCRALGHRYGEGRRYAIVQIGARTPFPVCKHCLSGYEDRQSEGEDITITRL